MAIKEPKLLTVREAAERTGAAIPTVNLWCRSGRLAGARQESSPYGDYWLIPESSLEGVVVRGRGRPPKQKADVIEFQTKTTRKLDEAVKHSAEREMSGKRKKVPKK